MAFIINNLCPLLDRGGNIFARNQDVQHFQMSFDCNFRLDKIFQKFLLDKMLHADQAEDSN